MSLFAVSVTSAGLIVRLPSTISNLTFEKFLLLFVKSAGFNFMSYVPALVPFTTALPLNVKSPSLYSGLLMLVTL